MLRQVARWILTHMNFFGHSVLAAQIRAADPRFVLGAMLPDFATMVGLRLTPMRDPALQQGIAHHHALDAIFHRAPAFLHEMGDAMARLQDCGLSRGAARAAAHLGIELVLDGLLVCRGHGKEAYLDALQIAHRLPDLHPMARGRNILHLTQRLQNAPLPESYTDPAFVAARLSHIVRGRPRLQFTTPQTPAVADTLKRIQTNLEGEVDSLLNGLALQLSQDRSPQ